MRERLETHAAVRLRPHADGNGTWEVLNLSDKTSRTVSDQVAMLLIAFMGGNTADDAVNELAERNVGTALDAELTIRALMDARLVVSESTPPASHVWAGDVLASWSRYGWSAAADYFISTYDYPFFPYDHPAGLAADRAVSLQYRREERDTDRIKRYAGPTKSYAAPPTPIAISEIETSFAQAWGFHSGYWTSSRPRTVRLDREVLLRLVSVTFGCLRQRPTDDPARAAPLLRKTSPSGGSRHPTEAYVVAMAVPGLEPAMYHFAVGASSLDRIAELPDTDRMAYLFDGLFRSRQERGVEPLAFILFTSLFERNMYRYREPRTFRTIFLDVGHLVSTLELVSASFGLSCYCQHGIADEPVETILGLDGLREGVMYGAAIGIPS